MNLEDYFKRLQRLAEQQKNRRQDQPETNPTKEGMGSFNY